MKKYFNPLVLAFFFSTGFLNPMLQTATGQPPPKISFGDQTLQVYPTDHDTSVPWGREFISADAISVIDGKANTVAIVNAYGNWNNGLYAAKICQDLNQYGYNDWYLPSATELVYIWENRNEIGGFSSMVSYWSSSEEQWGNEAAVMDFSSGFVLHRLKNELNRVRCVRRIMAHESEAKEVSSDYGKQQIMSERDERIDKPGVRGRVFGVLGWTNNLIVVTDERLTKIYGEYVIKDGTTSYEISNLPQGQKLLLHFMHYPRVWVTEEIIVSDWVEKNISINVEDYDIGKDLWMSSLSLSSTSFINFALGKAVSYYKVYDYGRQLRLDHSLFQYIHYLCLVGKWEIAPRTVETDYGDIELSGGGIFTFYQDGTGVAPLGDKFYWKCHYRKIKDIRNRLGVRIGVQHNLVITKSRYKDFYDSSEILATIYYKNFNHYASFDEMLQLIKIEDLSDIGAIIPTEGPAEKIEYQETESGLKYALLVETGMKKPETGDILSMEMFYSVRDSVLFDSRDMGMPMFLQMMEPEYQGDIYEGLALIAEGDSASFIIDAEVFFFHTVGMMELPPFVQEGDEVVFHVALRKIMDEEGFALEQERLMEQQMQEDMLRAEQEEGLMLDYLAGENITVAPTSTGLYYVEREQGDGARVQSGDMVAVHYEGRLLDGTVFDSSYQRGEPIEFTVGRGHVIPGWDEGIGMMQVGGKATLVIPSFLAYGDRGAGPMIPPFSTLVFDVELVKVIE